MFFYKKLRKELLLEPMFLGPNLVGLVRDRIFAEVEGTCLGKHGYVVSVSNQCCTLLYCTVAAPVAYHIHQVLLCD